MTDLRKLVDVWQRTDDPLLGGLLLSMAMRIEENSDDIKQLTTYADQQDPPPTTEKLTDQQKSIYLEQHPEQCPFCRSESIGVLEPFDGVKLFQSHACNDCKRSWKDHYTLTGVEEED